MDYTITATLDHGSLWVNYVQETAPFIAHYGDVVSILPDEGWELSTLTVKQGETDVTVIDGNFTMPAGDVTVTAVWENIRFGNPDFTMPAALTTIEESAFEGNTNISIVDAHNCTTIGKDAFKGCTNLTQIRLARNCAIDPAAFEPDQVICVFAPAGGDTETFCNGDNNLIFIEEATQE